MRIDIDASNIRAGGALTHLSETLKAARPAKNGIESVGVWGGRRTLERLPERPWLQPMTDPALNGSLVQRIQWQRAHAARLHEARCAALFVPGGIYTGAFEPFVAMSQNLLPFVPKERRRFGFSRAYLRYLILAWAQKATFHRAAGMIFFTETSKQIVTAQTGPLKAQVSIVPLGVGEVFRFTPREQRGPTSFKFEQPFRWLYVSIINHYKHQWHVAEAVARLRRQGLPVALDLVGPAYPPALRRMRNMLRQVDPAGEFIRYHGPIPFAHLPEWYRRADGFVFASTCENMPNILLEAMASALPIACSDRSPMPEILQHGGQYFHAEDPGSIAEALGALFTDEALRDRCAQSAYELSKRYTWERCAQDTFAALAAVGGANAGAFPKASMKARVGDSGASRSMRGQDPRP
ncbi:MAG: glycosyltransferase family 1 protein [Anaerolineales bacterium]